MAGRPPGQVNDEDVPQVAVFLDRPGASSRTHDQRVHHRAAGTARRPDPAVGGRVPRAGCCGQPGPRRRYAAAVAFGPAQGRRTAGARDRRRRPAFRLGRRALLEKAPRGGQVIPDDATVHFEGSSWPRASATKAWMSTFADRAGSEQAVMPTVLFLDGRRVEIRCQSHEQIRTRLLRVRQAIDTRPHRGHGGSAQLGPAFPARNVPLRVGPGYEDLIGPPAQEYDRRPGAAKLRRRHCSRQRGNGTTGPSRRGGELVWEGLVQAMVKDSSPGAARITTSRSSGCSPRSLAGTNRSSRGSGTPRGAPRLEGAGSKQMAEIARRADGTALIGRMLDQRTDWALRLSGLIP